MARGVRDIRMSDSGESIPTVPATVAQSDVTGDESRPSDPTPVGSIRQFIQLHLSIIRVAEFGLAAGFAAGAWYGGGDMFIVAPGLILAWAFASAGILASNLKTATAAVWVVFFAFVFAGEGGILRWHFGQPAAEQLSQNTAPITAMSHPITGEQGQKTAAPAAPSEPPSEYSPLNDESLRIAAYELSQEIFDLGQKYYDTSIKIQFNNLSSADKAEQLERVDSDAAKVFIEKFSAKYRSIQTEIESRTNDRSNHISLNKTMVDMASWAYLAKTIKEKAKNLP
jgi:hypothetical protein